VLSGGRLFRRAFDDRRRLLLAAGMTRFRPAFEILGLLEIEEQLLAVGAACGAVARPRRKRVNRTSREKAVAIGITP